MTGKGRDLARLGRKSSYCGRNDTFLNRQCGGGAGGYLPPKEKYLAAGKVPFDFSIKDRGPSVPVRELASMGLPLPTVRKCRVSLRKGKTTYRLTPPPVPL